MKFVLPLFIYHQLLANHIRQGFSQPHLLAHCYVQKQKQTNSDCSEVPHKAYSSSAAAAPDTSQDHDKLVTQKMDRQCFLLPPLSCWVVTHQQDRVWTNNVADSFQLLPGVYCCCFLFMMWPWMVSLLLLPQHPLACSCFCGCDHYHSCGC